MTGFRVPTLIVFDGLSLEILQDVKVQNDFISLLRKCQFWNLHVLITCMEGMDFLDHLVKSLDLGYVKYRLVSEEGQWGLVKEFPRSIDLYKFARTVWFKNEEQLNSVNLLYDGDRYTDSLGTISDLKQVINLLDDLRHPMLSPEFKVYIIYLNDNLCDSQQLESLLREEESCGVRFVLVGCKLPDHLSLLVTNANLIMMND